MQSPTEEHEERTSSCSAVLASYREWFGHEGRAAVVMGLLFVPWTISRGVSSLFDYANVAADILLVGYGAVILRVPPLYGLLVSGAWWAVAGLAWPFIRSLAGQPPKTLWVTVVLSMLSICLGTYRLLMYRRIQRDLNFESCRSGSASSERPGHTA